MTLDTQQRARSSHDHAWQLLPWFVTGRVSTEEAQRIERHLESCPACRSELESQRNLAALFRRDDAVMLAPQASLQKLLSRIDESPPDSSAIEADEGPAKKARVHRWLAIAAAVQAVAIGALLIVLWQQFDERLHAPRFSTLSATAAPSNAATLRVVFRSETRVADLQRVVRSIDAQIVHGPTEAGVYTLLLAPHGNPRAVAESLSRVRRERDVVFAEHVLPERSR